jgi:hypothetical protein
MVTAKNIWQLHLLGASCQAGLKMVSLFEHRPLSVRPRLAVDATSEVRVAAERRGQAYFSG